MTSLEFAWKAWSFERRSRPSLELSLKQQHISWHRREAGPSCCLYRTKASGLEAHSSLGSSEQAVALRSEKGRRPKQRAEKNNSLGNGPGKLGQCDTNGQGKRVYGNLGQRETGHARFEPFLSFFYFFFDSLHPLFSPSSSSCSRAVCGLIPFLLFVLSLLRKSHPLSHLPSATVIMLSRGSVRSAQVR